MDLLKNLFNKDKYMAKIEVEHRGLLSLKKFNELNKYFSKNGKFLGEKKRFSLISSTCQSSVREVKEDIIDIKLRVTNKKPELAVKYGKWSGKDARKEFNFDLDRGKYDDMLELLGILGYRKFVLMANCKKDYLYNGIEFALVQVPGWGYYFEAEMCVEVGEHKQAQKTIDRELDNLGMKVLAEEDFYDMLDSLNGREGYKIDLDKDDFSKIKKRFREYF